MFKKASPESLLTESDKKAVRDAVLVPSDTVITIPSPLSTKGSESDTTHPIRYNEGSVECIAAMESAAVGKPAAEGVNIASMIKYLWRYNSKRSLRDLKAVRWHLDRLVALVEAREGISSNDPFVESPSYPTNTKPKL